MDLQSKASLRPTQVPADSRLDANRFSVAGIDVAVFEASPLLLGALPQTIHVTNEVKRDHGLIRQSENVQVGRLCEDARMPISDVDWMCCFCGETVEEQGIDPCFLTIYDPGDPADSERGSQQFYAHVACLQTRMHPTVANLGNALDPDWKAFSRQDEP